MLLEAPRPARWEPSVMTERTLPIDYKVHARITSGRALPAEIAEIMAQLDKTTPGWRNAIRDVCDVQIPLPAHEIAPPLFAEEAAGSCASDESSSWAHRLTCRDRRLGGDFRPYSAM
jgi:hypothetical protein